MKELSSSSTFFFKYIILLTWICGYGYGTRQILLAGQSDPRWLQFFGVWIVFAGFIYFATGEIKKVRMGKETLIVSNFLRSEEIPLSEICSVDGTSLLSPRLVWFNLKNPSAFGKKIVFIPAYPLQKTMGKHDLVRELQKELHLPSA